MEKFSAFRDPGTGIQPFLSPVPPAGSGVLSNILLPIGYVIGALRTALILVVGLVYAGLVDGLCLLLAPIPPIYCMVTHLLTALLARSVLFLAGVWWIPVEVVTRKRGRGPKSSETWKPKSGDIIVSNWVSWIEVLWLAFRFNPIFVLPVALPPPSAPSNGSTPLTSTPGRRTGTGSAAISSPSTRAPSQRSSILGFRRVSLLGMLSVTGYAPSESSTFESLDNIRIKADRPIVVFPECTTSNGRGLLKFADIFVGVSVPVLRYNVFVMCVRYDPPTTFAPTLSHSIPNSTLNPLLHIFKLSSSLVPLTLSIRLLAPSESPSTGSFLASDFVSGRLEDQLSEVCAALISQIGKMKRVGMGWEDKYSFLEFYEGKKR